jgi:MFS transporter, DHA1 family, tetracycline resistance protein
MIEWLAGGVWMKSRLKDGKVTTFPILCVNFVGTLGFSIVLPFLVFLVTDWGGNAVIYGVIGATYSAFQLIGAPILGRWSDKFGRKRILLLSQLGTLASWLFFIIAFALPKESITQINSELLGSFTLTIPLLVLFFARALDGLTGGNISVANAYLSDISTDSTRNANFGKMAVSSNLGFMLGPAIAGLLGDTGWGHLPPVVAAFLISLVASGLIIFMLPESNERAMLKDPERPHTRQVLSHDHKPCVKLSSDKSPGIAAILKHPRTTMLLAINFFIMLGFNFFYVSFPMFAAKGLEWTVKETGIFFSVLSVAMVIVQGPILSRISKRLGEQSLAVIGGLFLAPSFILIGTFELPTIYTGVALLSLGNGLMWPSVSSLLSKAAGDRLQGAVQGIAGSVGATASILGLVIGGVLFDAMQEQVFIISASILLVAFLLTLLLGSIKSEDSLSDTCMVQS